MQSIKPQVFNYLTKVQKSDLCDYIASFVKKDYGETTERLVEKFIEDEKYYLEINSTRFPYLAEFINEPEFQKDLKLFIKENQKKYKYKEAQKPLYEKQKAYMKEQRKVAREKKMAKEPPTKAQLSYYKALCRKYKLECSLDLENASKLDLRNAIDEILKKIEASDRDFVLQKLDNIKKS